MILAHVIQNQIHKLINMKTFKDLQFKQHPSDMGGFQAIMEFENGCEVSVVCGEHMYSTPRENLYAASQYSTYEIATFKDGELLNDTVTGYLTPDEISEYMSNVELS